MTDHTPTEALPSPTSTTHPLNPCPFPKGKYIPHAYVVKKTNKFMELIRIFLYYFTLKLIIYWIGMDIKVQRSKMLKYIILLYIKKYHMTFLFFAYI